MRLVFLILLACCLPAHAKDFYSEEDIQRTFDWVKQAMNVHGELPIPTVMPSEEVPDDIYNQHCPYCEGKRINWFVPDRKEIWILYGKDLSVLVHEMVHYVQVVHEGATEDNDGTLEMLAIQYQNQFKKDL